jgi:DDE superfamily endonuclease
MRTRGKREGQPASSVWQVAPQYDRRRLPSRRRIDFSSGLRAVYLVYATDAGHAVVDRELYLPRSWTCNPERRRAAGVPDQVGFATKPALARRMLERALDARVPAAWVTGDEVYGADPALRAWLEARGVGYVLAVAWTTASRWRGGLPRRRAAGVCPSWGLAVRLGRQGRQGPPLPRLGVHPPGPQQPRPGRAALAPCPPQPQDQGAGLLPLLDAPARPR